ncbi:hypothetical protein BC940DRAFT_370593 [Gongronella butleri]|nr:hypothetical protein BC940DRAFT_370593 [Gongronella butleri]
MQKKKRKIALFHPFLLFFCTFFTMHRREDPFMEPTVTSGEVPPPYEEKVFEYLQDVTPDDKKKKRNISARAIGDKVAIGASYFMRGGHHNGPCCVVVAAAAGFVGDTVKTVTKKIKGTPVQEEIPHKS